MVSMTRLYALTKYPIYWKEVASSDQHLIPKSQNSPGLSATIPDLNIKWLVNTLANKRIFQKYLSILQLFFFFFLKVAKKPPPPCFFFFFRAIKDMRFPWHPRHIPGILRSTTQEFCCLSSFRQDLTSRTPSLTGDRTKLGGIKTWVSKNYWDCFSLMG